MKHKKRFSLKNKIFSNFLICSLCIVILIRNLDALYYEYLQKWLEPTLWDRLGYVYLIVSILIQVGAAFVFYKRTGKALKTESERRVREQNLIYAAMAHDLKTPMTSVQGFAKALSDGKIRPDEQREIFEIIYRKSNSMNDMVNTLFDYAKFGLEDYKPDYAELDICSLVREIVAENYCDFEEHGIELDIDIPDEGIKINADKTELKRAVSNLIVNIYKHNPGGIKAKVSVCKENDKAEIRIADSGNALPEDMDIFEPFVTENTARTLGHGTGLGLSIAKRIIERYGGELSVSTTDDEYTKMFVIGIE